MGGCDGLISHNTITSNTARLYGGGLAWCNATIEKNIITNNYCHSEGPGPDWGGGGLACCHGTIRNNIIANNRTIGGGGGFWKCNGLIENNTIVQNSSNSVGSGLYGCAGPVRNCIIWGNRKAPQVYYFTNPSFCCIEALFLLERGNISRFPHFINAEEGDYHLRSWSPCIDAGDPASDFSQEPEPNGGRIDMGAYGNTPEATGKSPDADGDSLPDDWEMHFFGGLAQVAEGDADGDGISNADEYLGGTRPIRMSWYVDRPRPASGDGTSWEKAFRTIQEAIDVAHTILTRSSSLRGFISRTFVSKARMSFSEAPILSTQPLLPTQ